MLEFMEVIHGAIGWYSRVLLYNNVMPFTISILGFSFITFYHSNAVVLKELGLKKVIIVMMCRQFIGWYVRSYHFTSKPVDFFQII